MQFSVFMRKILYLSIILVLSAVFGLQAQVPNPYGLPIVATTEAYEACIAADSANLLVDLSNAIPGVVLDIRYATANNFVGQAVYEQPAAFARKPVADALAEVQQELSLLGLGLKIFDAYRPYAVTLLFYEKVPDTVFVAAPWRGSRHNRGCAVDLTLVDLESGQELTMPTAYDDFSGKARPGCMDLPQEAIHNRQILLDVMHHHGFDVYESEWWHYDFRGWERYDLMDIPFSELMKGGN